MTEIEEQPQEPKKKTLFDCTLEELTHKMGNIQPKDLGSKDGITINMDWNQIIRAVNYMAGTKVLNWKSTATEALEAVGRFLV